MSLRVSRAEGGTKDPSAEIGDEGLPGNRRLCGKRHQQPAGVDGHGISWPFAVGYESALDVFGQKNAPPSSLPASHSELKTSILPAATCGY